MLDHVRDSFLDGSMTEIQELAVSSCLEGVGATEIGENIFQIIFLLFSPRFVTIQNCQNSCQHKIQMFEVSSSIRIIHKLIPPQIQTCHQPIMKGSCNETLARWGFDMDTYSCRPFYYSGCGGNYNNFLSRQQCRSVCPDTLQPAIDKPVIDMEDGVHRVLEGENVTISVNIR